MIAQKEKITSKLILNYGNMPEDIMKVDKTFFQTCSSFSTNSVHGCFASGIKLVFILFLNVKLCKGRNTCISYMCNRIHPKIISRISKNLISTRTNKFSTMFL